MTSSNPIVDDESTADLPVADPARTSTAAVQPFQFLPVGDASAVCEIDGECA